MKYQSGIAAAAVAARLVQLTGLSRPGHKYFYIMVYDKYGRKSDSACRVHSGQIALINENLKYLD